VRILPFALEVRLFHLLNNRGLLELPREGEIPVEDFSSLSLAAPRQIQGGWSSHSYRSFLRFRGREFMVLGRLQSFPADGFAHRSKNQHGNDDRGGIAPSLH